MIAIEQMTFGQATMDAATHHADTFRTDLTEWLATPVNFAVWSSFVYQANAVWNKGIRHYSARTIGEYLRHHSAMSDSGTDFKLNDHLWPDLARLYMLMNPQREGFFEFRGRRAA